MCIGVQHEFTVLCICTLCSDQIRLISISIISNIYHFLWYPKFLLLAVLKYTAHYHQLLSPCHATHLSFLNLLSPLTDLSLSLLSLFFYAPVSGSLISPASNDLRICVSLSVHHPHQTSNTERDFGFHLCFLDTWAMIWPLAFHCRKLKQEGREV